VLNSLEDKGSRFCPCAGQSRKIAPTSLYHFVLADEVPLLLPRPWTSLECYFCCLRSILSWVMSAVGGLSILQLLGVNLQPIWAVGGAGSIIVGLATQTLLTNSLMGFNFVSHR
jgi:small-conductance mechanosensitive channel